MKISPVSGPGAIPMSGTPESVRTAKAIEAFNRGASSYDKNQASAQSQTTGAPPVNQNAISAEELSVVQPPTEEVESDNTELQAQGEEQGPEVPEPAKPVEDPALSRQFAQLARQERALRAKQQQQEQAWKAKEADLAAREAALQPQAKPDMSTFVSIDQLKQNAWAVLAKHGISYDDVTQQAMNYQPVNPQIQAHIESLEAKLAKLEANDETRTKSYAEQQQAQYQAAVKQIEMDVTNLVKQDPQTFEVIAKSGKGAIREVVKLIEDTYAKDGILMTAEEAAQEVEDYMTEQSYKTLSQIDKIKKRLAQPPATAKPTDMKTPIPAKQPQPMKTLTNATSSSRQLSAKERAILAFKGELK